MKYLLAAFNARPLGLLVPPNWIALGVVGLLGVFVNPGFWLIGAGLEAAYLWAVSSHPRFRATVDGPVVAAPDLRHAQMLAGLTPIARKAQEALEARGAELVAILARTGAFTGQEETAQLCWLHLRLLAARSGVAAVAGGSMPELAERQATIDAQLADADQDDATRGSLERQREVLIERQASLKAAVARLRFIDAELERIRQQLELAREQALLAADAAGLARSVDLVAGSLTEANRWLADRRDILADLDPLAEAPSAQHLFTPRPAISQ